MVAVVSYEDEKVSYMYSISRDGPELFADEVPAELVEDMAQLMHFLGNRKIKANDTACFSGLTAEIIAAPDHMLPMLFKDYLKKAESRKEIFILFKVHEDRKMSYGWSTV